MGNNQARGFGILAAVLVLVGQATTTLGADHRDGPRIAQNTTTLGSIDINDVYVFRAPHNADRTVMIMTLSAAAGVVGPATFLPGALYEFRIDNSGDTVSDVIFQVNFSGPNNQGRQFYQVRMISFRPLKLNQYIATGMTSVASDKGLGYSRLPGNGAVTAGLFDDPFFFDLLAFNKFIKAANADAPLGDRVAPFLPPNFPNNFFANYNVIAIVLEVPSAWLRANSTKPNITFWARTVFDAGDGRGFAQYDRMGLPAINTAVIQPYMDEPGSRLTEDNFNFAIPQVDADFRGIAAARISRAYGVSRQYAAGVAAAVLPDVIPFNTLSYSGFLNGRQLADDVIDAEFSLLTDGALESDRVVNDSVFRGSFPYLGAPLPRAATLKALRAFHAADTGGQAP